MISKGQFLQNVVVGFLRAQLKASYGGSFETWSGSLTILIKDDEGTRRHVFNCWWNPDTDCPHCNGTAPGKVAFEDFQQMKSGTLDGEITFNSRSVRKFVCGSCGKLKVPQIQGVP